MSYVMPVKLEDSTRFRLKSLGDARKRSMTWMVKEAIDEYVEREEKKEKLKEELSSAWREYQLTGLHVTHEEMQDWITKLTNGEDAEPPKCHV